MEFARERGHNNLYFRAFLERLTLRNSCYECPFAKIERTGDITLGDFWGIWDYDAKIDDKKGTSLVLINTQKGKQFFERLKSKFSLLKIVPIEMAVNGNPTLNKAIPAPKERAAYLEIRKKYDFDTAVEKALGNFYKRKCAILNFWWSPIDGYGAALTALALYHLVDEMGVSEPCLIQTIFGGSIQEARAGRHYQFCARYAKCSKDNYLTRSDCKKLNACVLFVGDDWYATEKWEKYEEDCKQAGIQVVYFPYTKSISSTKIRETLQQVRGWTLNDN